MRERLLILARSPCETNFYDHGPRSLFEAEMDEYRCPKFDECRRAAALDPDGPAPPCLMLHAVALVRQVLMHEVHLSAGIRQFIEEQRDADVPEGYLWSPNGEEFERVCDFCDVVELVKEFAAQVMGGEGARDFQGLAGEIINEDGAVDVRKMAALEGRYGKNGGQGCDVLDGPCSCGATHDWNKLI